MLTRTLKTITLILFFYTACHALTGDEALEYFRSVFAQKVTTFRADIEQTTVTDLSDPIKMKGVLILKKPDRFSIDYTLPEKQLVKCNGKKVWIYMPGMNQAVSQNLDELKNKENILFGFVSFLDAIKRDFTSALTKKDAKRGILEVESVPRSGNYAFSSIKFTIDMNTWLPVKISVNYTETSYIFVKFYNPQTNISVKDSLFEFTPPEGTVVMESPLK